MNYDDKAVVKIEGDGTVAKCAKGLAGSECGYKGGAKVCGKCGAMAVQIKMVPVDVMDEEDEMMDDEDGMTEQQKMMMRRRKGMNMPTNPMMDEDMDEDEEMDDEKMMMRRRKDMNMPTNPMMDEDMDEDEEMDDEKMFRMRKGMRNEVSASEIMDDEE